jgi:hypothetical protein
MEKRFLHGEDEGTVLAGTLLQLARSASVKQTSREGLDGWHPKHVAPAAVFRDDQQLAFDAVTNPSVTDACVVTDSRLDPGSDAVDLKLSLNRQICVCELGASVVWNRRGGAGEKGFEGGLQLHGVQFIPSNAHDKSRIHALFRRIVVDWVDRLEARRILAGANLVDVFHPSMTDLLLSALAGELDELGRKMLKITGLEIVTDHSRAVELKRTKRKGQAVLAGPSPHYSRKMIGWGEPGVRRHYE